MSSEKIIVKFFIEYEFLKEDLHLKVDEILQVSDTELEQKYRNRAVTRAKNNFIFDIYKFVTDSPAFQYEVIELKNSKANE